MDESTFDAITRSAVTEAGPRRAIVRLLTGTVLGAIVSRLAPLEEATAKAKRHKGKVKHGHQQGGPSHRHHKAERGAQSEGKRKKGKKGKSHHKSPPPLPPGCQNCNACQMCQDGACVPDPDLGGVPCQGSGPHCNYCLLGECVATEDRPCDDGFCPHRGTCCPGEKYCSDPETPIGFACVGPTDCCPNQKKCGNACISLSGCCAPEKKCPGGSCVAQQACCPETAPATCGECEVAVCNSGNWVCQRQNDCCPAGGVFCRSVPGQYWPNPGISLPNDCCPPVKMFTDPTTGELGCAEPRSGGTAWMCE